MHPHPPAPTVLQELAGGFVKNGYNDGHFGNRGKHDSNLEIIHAHNCIAKQTFSHKGAFTNYIENILPIIDHLPTPC